jgi:hypothetical protein
MEPVAVRRICARCDRHQIDPGPTSADVGSYAAGFAAFEKSDNLPVHDGYEQLMFSLLNGLLRRHLGSVTSHRLGTERPLLESDPPTEL